MSVTACTDKSNRTCRSWYSIKGNAVMLVITPAVRVQGERTACAPQNAGASPATSRMHSRVWIVHAYLMT